MKGNDFVVILLRSSLHRLMGNTLLISMRGRKMGRTISTPVNYYREGDTLWIVSNRQRKWWRNIGAGTEVHLHLSGRDLTGLAELVRDEKAVASRAEIYVRGLPGAARALGIRTENGVANLADLAEFARCRRFVKVCVSQTAA